MRDWPRHYKLVGRTPVAVDMMTWAMSLEQDRHVALDEVNPKCHVSTVFLGLDHNFSGRGDPLLFETMVFGGPLDGDTWRYCTYAEAERGHAEALRQARVACAKVKAMAEAAGARK